ncbi:MAG: beta-ketoacyl-ACP synthase III [Candidatus Melainabacteria bacterium]|nr:beta-ketoacyl-ACP synthase III [Candidatus Melainabacteria bacterium]
MTELRQAYITASGTFLPGDPVDNENIEAKLGYVHGKPSKLKKRILASNGILTRHYALDDKQRSTHQNRDLAVAAARECLKGSEIDEKSIDLLAVASTQGDLPLPGLASLVQAELAIGPLEIITTHGVCSASMMALKSAFNQLRVGEKKNAMVVASEMASRLLKKSRYEAVSNLRIDLESEFLRWMLSDGAGAFLLQDKPRWRGLSLRIDWIEIVSFASHYDLCMSCGTNNQSLWSKDFEQNQKNIHDLSWQDYTSYADAEANGALLIRQNLKLLEDVVKVGVDGFLKLINDGKIKADEIDHFVCHYSSHHFKGRILELLKLAGALIPEEKWFTNLYTKGNTGCASIFIALDELLKTGSLKTGQTIFCVVPESGRFANAYMKLTVVGGRDSGAF